MRCVNLGIILLIPLNRLYCSERGGVGRPVRRQLGGNSTARIDRLSDAEEAENKEY